MSNRMLTFLVYEAIALAASVVLYGWMFKKAFLG